MPDYKQMYFHLFQVHCQVLELLAKAGQATEEMYLSSPDPLDLPAETQPPDEC